MERMTDTNSKPEVDAPEGPAPVELVIEDIVVGDGAEATRCRRSSPAGRRASPA